MNARTAVKGVLWWAGISAVLILGSLFFKFTKPTIITGSLMLVCVTLITAVCRNKA